MPSSVDATSRDRDCLLGRLAEPDYQYRPEQPFAGSIRPGDRVAIVADVVTTGTSTLDAIDRCQHAGYGITTVVILVDREEGGLARIRDAAPGVPCSALFTRAELQRRLEEQRAAAR